MNMNTSLAHDHGGALHCHKDALTDVFGWFLQVLLACLAFTCLIGKRFCEPKIARRSWLIWFYDTSKQGMGALVIHLSNVWLAGQYTGDPCTWYIINFLLDSSVGLLIMFIGIRISQHLSKRKGWDAINFGEYGIPPSMNVWLVQCCLYVGLMVIVKTCITLLMQLNFWEVVKSFILPIHNPKVELVFVMLIIPFFVNILMFWVTDNFLMHRTSVVKSHKANIPQGLLHRMKVHYKYIRQRSKRHNSESDVLLSADDELLDSEDPPQTSNIRVVI